MLNEPFDQKELQLAKSKFEALRRDMGSSDMELIILGKDLEIKRLPVLQTILSSQLERGIFEKIQKEYTEFLRQELKNTSIVIEVSYQEETKKKRPFTSKEKYEYMVKENPAIKELKTRLGLDFEF